MAVSLGRLCIRNINTYKILRDSLTEPLKIKQPSNLDHGGMKGYKLWKNIFYFVCCPSITLSGIFVFMFHKEESLPDFKKYPHLRIRKKPFPWGDGQKTLFHNSHRNALPDGYEHQ